MKLKRLLIITFVGAQFAFAARADDEAGTNAETEVQTLKEEVQRLEQKVDTLEHQQQENHAAETNALKNTAQLSVGSNGVIFTSANSNFVVGLHAWLQVDSRTFLGNVNIPGTDGFLLRRARPIITGTLYHDFDFNLTPEFAGNSPQILDAYLNYHDDPELQLMGGKYKPPVGLEALQPDIYTFFNERSLATDLVPYRTIGAELHGYLFGDSITYAAGIFNGLPDYNTSTINTNIDNGAAFAGRLFTRPFNQTSISPLKGFGVGVSGSYEDDQRTAAALTPGYTTDGQERFFTYTNGVVGNGTHWRISPQGDYYYGPLGFMGEYVISDQQIAQTTGKAVNAGVRNTAWEVSGGWILTGEDDSYYGITPQHPFNLHNGGWGAWQVVGRYENLDVDHDVFTRFANPAMSASGARAWAVGLNWYLNNVVRVNLSFSHTWFMGSASSNPVTKQPENVLFTRMQLAF